MTPPVRRSLGVLATLAIAACLGGWLAVAPSRGLEAPLPSIDLGTPLPSIDLGTPLPSIDLGTPLPSIDLGTPLPSIDLGTPLPSIPPTSSSPGGSPSVSPGPGSSVSGTASPAPRASGSSGGEGPPGREPQTGQPAGARTASGVEPAGEGEPRVPELVPIAPTLPGIGAWLVPSLGVAVPALIVAAFVGLQLLGGAAAVRLARRTLDRVGSAAPPWARP